ncbi:MAG: 5-formyltetrahydrofolate cyclo-ligase [Crocinitomicaceae bacterium]
MKKKELRKIYKEKRTALTNKERNQYSEKILDSLKDLVNLKGKVVSVFAPIERFAEINTYPLLVAKESTFVLPVMKGDDLIHVQFEELKQLEVNDWGIPEPTYGEDFDPQAIDIVIVPMLVFDLKGYRVGYGKGFYDQFLAQCRKDAQFIGLSIFDPIECIEDVHENDVQLHQIITPSKVYRF